MSYSNGDWDIWPSDNMDFWKLTDVSNTITITWSKNCFIDYKKLAYDFYDCGYEVFTECIERDPCGTKSDMWFLTGIFLLRQSIELGLKSLLCRVVHNKDSISRIFKEHCHNLSMLFNRYITLSSERFLTSGESDWLEQYLSAVEYVDEKSNMFRFPFDNGFLQQYRDEFLDTAAIANNLVQAFTLVKKCIEKGAVATDCEFDSSYSSEFLISANQGFGNCYLWQPISDDGFHVKVKGYMDVSEHIFHTPNVHLKSKVYPLIFMLRNTVELALKRVFYKNLDYGVSEKAFNSKRKSHLIKKDLWKNVKPILIQYAQAQNQDLSIIETVEHMLFVIDTLDKKGDTFRYPTSYGLQYRLADMTLDLKNVYEYFRAIINFLNGCDCMFDAISEYETDMRSEYQDYYSCY